MRFNVVIVKTKGTQSTFEPLHSLNRPVKIFSDSGCTKMKLEKGFASHE